MNRAIYIWEGSEWSLTSGWYTETEEGELIGPFETEQEASA